jgi:hypothetical protein
LSYGSNWFFGSLRFLDIKEKKVEKVSIEHFKSAINYTNVIVGYEFEYEAVLADCFWKDYTTISITGRTVPIDLQVCQKIYVI